MNSLLLSVLHLAIPLILSSQQVCYIQVKAEPNIFVFLNDEFKGKTSADIGGLIIGNLKVGSYNIKVVKDGYVPQTEVIVLKSGEVKIYQVKPFVPQYKITQSGNKQEQTIELKTGSLKVQSLPVEIQIEITDLGIKSMKTQDEWKIQDIPIGEHKLKFVWGNKILNDTVLIKQDLFKYLFVNLINGKIEIREYIIDQKIVKEKMVLFAQKKRQEEIVNRTRAALSNDNNSTLTISPASDETKQDSNLSFNLVERGVVSLPIPENNYQGEGRIVVEISVDRNGKVIQAVPGVKGSTTLDEYLLKVVKDAALKSLFESKSDAPAVQKGTITYSFILK
jgi:hypothetical protein